VERDADLRFGQVDDAEESVRRLLVVVVTRDAILRLGDRPLDVFNVAIDEIHLAVRGVDPRAAVDPRAPLIETSDRHLVTRGGGLGDASDVCDVKGMVFMVVQAKVHIRTFVKCPVGVRAAEDDGRDARDCAELGYEAFEQTLLLMSEAMNTFDHLFLLRGYTKIGQKGMGDLNCHLKLCQYSLYSNSKKMFYTGERVTHMTDTKPESSSLQKVFKAAAEISGLATGVVAYIIGITEQSPGPLPKTTALLLVIFTTIALYAWRWPIITSQRNETTNGEINGKDNQTNIKNSIKRRILSIFTASNESYFMPLWRRRVELTTLVFLCLFTIAWTSIKAPAVLAEINPSDALAFTECSSPLEGVIIVNFKTTDSGKLMYEQRIANDMEKVINGENICRLATPIETSDQALDILIETGAYVIVWGLSDQVTVDTHVQTLSAEEVIWSFAQDPDFQRMEAEHITFLTKYIISLYAYLNVDNATAQENLEKALATAEGQDWAAKYPKNLADGYDLLGQIAVAEGVSPEALEAAIAAYTRAIELNPTLDAAILNRGALCSMASDVTCAMQDYTTLIEKKSTLASIAYMNRALLQPTREAAEADYEAAIRLEPAAGYYARATARVNWNDWVGAISDFENAVQAEPQNCYYQHSLGKAYLQSGQYKQAIDAYTKIKTCLVDNQVEEDAQIYIEDLQFLCSEQAEVCEAVNQIITTLNHEQ